MKRILVSALVALVTAGGVFWPLLQSIDSSSPVPSVDPVTITDYQADYKVDANGHLDAVETLTTKFPSGSHGIFRFWDVTDAADDSVRYIPEEISVSLDGQAEQTELQWQKGRQFRVAKIGDPDSFVSAGSHVYRISYRIAGVLSPTGANGGSNSSSWAARQKGKAVFPWQVVAPGWQMIIRRSRVNISLPAKPGQISCTESKNISAIPCTITGAGTKNLTVSTGPLPPKTPVSLYALMPLDAPERNTLPWTVEFDPIYGRSVSLLWLVLGLSVVGLLFGYLWQRRGREQAPGFPVMYEPPDQLGPVQAAYVVYKKLPAMALISTLLYQAEQGLTELRDKGERRWDIHGLGTPEQWAATDPVTRDVGESLGVTTPSGSFAADGSTKSGLKLQTTKGEIKGFVTSWATEAKVIVPDRLEFIAKCLVVIAMLFAGVVFVFNPLGMTILGLPFTAFATGGAGMLLAGAGTRRTDRKSVV